MVDLLRYDLKALSFARDDMGERYLPTGIVESKGGESNHQREVILGFPKPTPKTKWLELVIQNIAAVKERTFRWDLQRSGG